MYLREMAQEYRSNIALLELRMKQLQVAQRRTQHKEVRYRLRQRIGCLRVLINEGRKTVFMLEHHYDKGGQYHANKRAV